MIGIKGLAQHLNLSIGTVSRALNNRPDVSHETRMRVARGGPRTWLCAQPVGAEPEARPDRRHRLHDADRPRDHRPWRHLLHGRLRRHPDGPQPPPSRPGGTALPVGRKRRGLSEAHGVARLCRRHHHLLDPARRSAHRFPRRSARCPSSPSAARAPMPASPGSTSTLPAWRNKPIERLVAQGSSPHRHHRAARRHQSRLHLSPTPSARRLRRHGLALRSGTGLSVPARTRRAATPWRAAGAGVQATGRPPSSC